MDRNRRFYKVIAGCTVADVESQVNYQQTCGWRPAGSMWAGSVIERVSPGSRMIMNADDRREELVCQPMVRGFGLWWRIAGWLSRIKREANDEKTTEYNC